MNCDAPKLMPLAEVARLLNQPPQRVQRWLSAGTLRADFQTSRLLLFRPESITHFIASDPSVKKI
jgi:hypothetical protein